MVGTVAVTSISREGIGNLIRVEATVTFSGAYVAGGDNYTAALFGLQDIVPTSIAVMGGGTTNGTKTVLQDVANAKFKLFDTAGAEAGNGDQSANSFRAVVLGRD